MNCGRINWKEWIFEGEAMNYSYSNPNGYTPPFNPPPVPPQYSERLELRSAASFVGAQMLFLTISMQFAYPLVVLILSLLGVVAPGAIALDQLGLSNTAYLCVYAVVYILAMGLPLIMLIGKRRLFSLKPKREPLTGGVIFLVMLGSIGACMGANIVTSILLTILEHFNFPIPEMPDMMERTPISLVLNLIIIAVLPAILEEAVFRGSVLRVLRPFGDWFAVLVSSVLFGLMHGNVRQIPFAIIVGLVLGWLYVSTNSLRLPMAVHFANNALSVCMEYFGFSLSENATGYFYAFIIYGLAIIGGIALMVLLFVRGSQLRIQRSNSCLGAGERLTTLFKAPSFVISVIVFICLTGLELIV